MMFRHRKVSRWDRFWSQQNKDVIFIRYLSVHLIKDLPNGITFSHGKVLKKYDLARSLYVVSSQSETFSSYLYTGTEEEEERVRRSKKKSS